ncbi:hypothetical protein C8F01DRAFT_1109570 [Mycena amicta]|nr:hypothetical protein C8F01DRAFT_1109570 [Mycena amicta]
MSFDGAGLFSLDAAQAKQMAAINAANNLRNRSSFLGESSTLLQDSSMAQRGQGQQPAPRARQTGFLNGLARIMQSRGSPLPPALTGVDTPSFDPVTTTWKSLEIADVGVVRIAGRDVDLFKLWGLVGRSGGAQQLSRDNAWTNILPHFNLPDEIHPTGRPISQILAQFYQAMLLPFEEMYRNNIANQRGVQRQVLPETPARRLSSASQGSAHNPEGTLENNDQDLGLKRKLESEEADAKRARQKTETAGMDGVDQPSTATLTPGMPRPSRRTRNRIEYVPRVRELDTAGGRELRVFEGDNLASRRQMRELNDWGVLSVDALTLSLRSQLSTELSYALTAVTVLSTLRGDQPSQGFPIGQCHELLEELLDLLQERAFGVVEDSLVADEAVVATHKELVTALLDLENEPFAGLQPRQGSKDPRSGPLQRPGNVILSITNIIRNLSYIPDNFAFLAQQERLLDLMLRVCAVTRKDGQLAAVSSSLSLGDVITVRKDTLLTLMHLSSPLPGIILTDTTSKVTARITHRAFHLLASFLVDPSDAVSPFGCIQMGATLMKTPFLADVALETFTRLSQADPTRKVFSKVVPAASIEQLFTSCMHRLPVVDQDFQTIARDRWLGYAEKVLMTMYALAFIAPPSLKRKIKADRSLGFKSVMLRMVHKFLTFPNPEIRSQFSIAARRAVETMKVLDDCQDLFDTSEPTVTTLSFGMGYGEGGESNHERGTGLLGGHRELTWDLLMLREVMGDSVLFNELESLSRVE